MSMKGQFEKIVGQLLNSLIRLQVMVLGSNLKTNALLCTAPYPIEEKLNEAGWHIPSSQ